MGVLESPGNVLDFLSVTEWEPCKELPFFECYLCSELNKTLL